VLECPMEIPPYRTRSVGEFVAALVETIMLEQVRKPSCSELGNRCGSPLTASCAEMRRHRHHRQRPSSELGSQEVGVEQVEV
jgi:hypothetical protein